MHFYKAIITKYHGPTNTRGSRVSATDEDGNRISITYDDHDQNPHVEVALALCAKMNWKGSLNGGHLKSGMAFTFISDESKIDIPSGETLKGSN